MSYEKFITDFLNTKPSDLSKISTSTSSDGSVLIVSIIFRKFYFPFVKNKIILLHNPLDYLDDSFSYNICFPNGYQQRVVNGRKQASMHFPRREMHL